MRGAITATENSRSAIITATEKLIIAMIEANSVQAEDVAAVFFTTTGDLFAEFPAAAARRLGWNKVPLLCGHEMAVPGRLGSCIRILMLVNTELDQEEVKHIYLDGATILRPDLSGEDDPQTAGTTF